MLRRLLSIPQGRNSAALQRRRQQAAHLPAPVDERAEPIEIRSAALGIRKRV